MAEKEKTPEEKQLVTTNDMGLEDTQLAEQLYSSAGLGPVVDAGIKDHDKRIQTEDKLLTKVLGPRTSDIKAYGEAVAKRVAFAVYNLLNKQYGGKVGDLRAYILSLEDERNRANTRYDELMGRVVGILGEEYKQLRTDSNAFMEKLTGVLGEDLKESKIDKKALAETLGDIDGLRARIKSLEEEKAQQKEGYESTIATLKSEHQQEVAALGARVADLESRVQGLESEKAALTRNLAQLKEDYGRLETAITTLSGAIPHEEIGTTAGREAHDFALQDSKVPDPFIKGVGKLINFRKYLAVAGKRGAELAGEHAEQTLRGKLA